MDKTGQQDGILANHKFLGAFGQEKTETTGSEQLDVEVVGFKKYSQSTAPLLVHEPLRSAKRHVLRPPASWFVIKVSKKKRLWGFQTAPSVLQIIAGNVIPRDQAVS